MAVVRVKSFRSDPRTNLTGVIPHPDRVRLQGPAIDAHEDPLPDVVLEAGHATDVRLRATAPRLTRWF